MGRRAIVALDPGESAVDGAFMCSRHCGRAIVGPLLQPRVVGGYWRDQDAAPGGGEGGRVLRRRRVAPARRVPGADRRGGRGGARPRPGAHRRRRGGQSSSSQGRRKRRCVRRHVRRLPGEPVGCSGPSRQLDLSRVRLCGEALALRLL